MKKCSVCGKEFPDSVKFCTSCGSQLESINSNNVNSETKKFPTIFKVLPIIVIALIAIFFLLRSVFSGVGKGFPAVVKGSYNSAVAFSNNETFSTIFSKKTSGSFNINMSKLPEVIENGRDLLSDISRQGNCSGDITFYYDKKGTLIKGDANVLGFKFKDNTLYYDYKTKELIVNCPKLLGDTNYGLKVKDLQDSWIMDFVKNENVLLYEFLNSFCENLNKNNATEEFVKDLKKIFEEFSKEFVTVVDKRYKFKNENKNIKIGNKEEKTLVVSTTIDSEKLNDSIVDILGWAQSNKNIKNFIEKHNDEIISIYNSIYSYSKISDAYEKYDSFLEETLDSLDRNPLNFKEEIEMRFYISKGTKQLVCIEGEMDNGYIGSIKMGPDMKDFKEFSFQVEAGYYGSYEATFRLKSEKNNVNNYNLLISILGKEYNVDIEWNKKNGEFNIVSDEIMNVKFNSDGVFKIGKETVLDINKINITINNYYGAEEFNIKPNIVFTLKDKDKMPNVPKNYENLVDMSNNELGKIIEKASSNLLGNLFG